MTNRYLEKIAKTKSRKKLSVSDLIETGSNVRSVHKALSSKKKKSKVKPAGRKWSHGTIRKDD